MNRVILMGVLGADPKFRYTGGGQAVCTFTLVTEEEFIRKNGSNLKRKENHKVVMYGGLAEAASNKFKKGLQVSLEGSIRSREWLDVHKQKRIDFEIVAHQWRAY